MACGWIKYFSKIIFIDIMKFCIFSNIYNFTMQSIFAILLKQPESDHKSQVSWLHMRLYHKAWSDFWVVSHFIWVGAYLISSYVYLYMHIYILHIYIYTWFHSNKDVTDFQMSHHVSYTKREKKMAHFTVHINCKMNPVARIVKIWNTES